MLEYMVLLYWRRLIVVNLDEYDFKLPEEMIAQKLASPRDSANLLISNKDGSFEHRKFSDLTSYLKAGDVLVLNSTKVSQAKLAGKKETGSPVEVMLVNKIGNEKWECRIKGKNPRAGVKFIFRKGMGEVLETKDEDLFIVRIDDAVLKDAILPTPPYITRTLGDDEYQTIYADKEGSLAAPTAGLHFTKQLLSKIEKKGVKIVFVTLHVSYGTFKKIRNGVENYVMDPEYFEISKSAAETINKRKGRLFVVGTTTLKALETSSKDRKIKSGIGQSTLFIYPPFKFHSGADVLITNFHLPKSTLILLTCAFGGRERILKAYDKAIKKKYKFYSLGDAMMIEK